MVQRCRRARRRAPCLELRRRSQCSRSGPVCGKSSGIRATLPGVKLRMQA